ncbi:MAG: thiamine pyrophosphate-dependent enzyme [Kiritimatiellae bacterium]|jgi:indolepyruvate ferredoxin oxidoreductase alpha subunit|nr:thiamine pyrophosphate-dependent enzyme [Kiritimatiellia bacterium]
MADKILVNGNVAVAHAALAAGVKLGVGYPGTPSTEILETFSAIGGHAQWAPNEKVALEVGIGAAFGAARTIVTMKHVGVNVAADPLFTVAYEKVDGALVIVVADDPGMASSQNEQDSRNYARAAGVVMLEPSTSQEAYDFLGKAIEISERWNVPVFLRLTTRICHSKTVVELKELSKADFEPNYEKNIPERVMVPALARAAHRRIVAKLHEIEAWACEAGSGMTEEKNGDKSMGIITSGIAAVHVYEAAPEAGVLKLNMSYPFPNKVVEEFAAKYDKVVIVEEGDRIIEKDCRMIGVEVVGKPEEFVFGELNVARTKKLIAGDGSPDAPTPKDRPPQLCVGCPHRYSFQVLKDLDAVVTGDIGCYTLGVMPPFEKIDTCVCMGGSIGVGLGLRHVLPDDQARKVVSVIGDSTFMHSGLTGIVDMVYNRPKTGHVVMILDNSITAMTGMQEHPGTGRALDHSPAYQVSVEDVCKGIGVENVAVFDPLKEQEEMKATLKDYLDNDKIGVIIARRACIIALKNLSQRK